MGGIAPFSVTEPIPTTATVIFKLLSCHAPALVNLDLVRDDESVEKTTSALYLLWDHHSMQLNLVKLGLSVTCGAVVLNTIDKMAYVLLVATLGSFELRYAVRSR